MLSGRTFGIEIEHGNDKGLRHYNVQEALVSGGFGKWANCHVDGSGIEVVSPVLCGEDGLAEVKAVFEFLQNIGGVMGDDDGLHVHYGGKGFLGAAGRDPLYRLLESWYNNQALIDKTLPNRRVIDRSIQGTIVCRRINKQHYSDIVHNLKNCPPDNHHTGSRFYALNVAALDAHKTVEVRQHHGTFDFDRAAAWIRFGDRFLDTVQACKSALPTHKSVDELLANIGLEDSDIKVLKEVPL